MLERRYSLNFWDKKQDGNFVDLKTHGIVDVFEDLQCREIKQKMLSMILDPLRNP